VSWGDIVSWLLYLFDDSPNVHIAYVIVFCVCLICLFIFVGHIIHSIVRYFACVLLGLFTFIQNLLVILYYYIFHKSNRLPLNFPRNITLSSDDGSESLALDNVISFHKLVRDKKFSGGKADHK
jgi:hypothetical protein